MRFLVEYGLKYTGSPQTLQMLIPWLFIDNDHLSAQILHSWPFAEEVLMLAKQAQICQKFFDEII